MKKRFKGILSLLLICTVLILSLPTAYANEALYDRYSIFDLDLSAIDNYITLRLSDEDAYKVFVNYYLIKNKQVQGIYSEMAEELNGNEGEEEVLVLFEKLVYREAVFSLNNGAPISEFIDSASGKLKQLGVDTEALKVSENKEKVIAELSGKAFDDVESLAEEIKTVMNGGKAENSNKKAFTDIEDAKTKEAVDYLAKGGIVSGRTETEFCPNDSVKREEFAKMLVLSLELYDEKADTDFTDVSSDAWYYRYVASATKKELIKGYGDVFGVGDFITRQDVATIVYRAFGDNLDKAGVVEPNLADKDKISDYAKEAVYALIATETMSKNGDNSFAPTENATRAHVAEAIYNLCRGNKKGE